MGRILVVDDDPDIRFAIRHTLEMAGHDVLEAADGANVADLAVQNNLALILLDIEMPLVDGIEVLRRLQADPQTERTRVVMITARDRRGDMSTAVALGARDYVTKPWEDGEIERAVEWALAGAERGHQGPVKEVTAAVRAHARVSR